ncbi:transposase [filamentous cyanobacterium LEGE 11480]|uniref:Transposase n=1 Tax=Romeriopsis navalis LEGE 11480 TaxID=2777977 RepID=A0A928VUV1_9CYAN|nr:transposase [Romeriopsis navalis LEGE 11480]
MCKQSGKLPKNGDLQKVCITQAKKTEQRAWLSEVSNIPLQQSIHDLGVAFKNFFDSRSGKRKGPKVNAPGFKKKSNRQSARFCKGGFSIKAGKVYLAQVGFIKTRWSRPNKAIKYGREVSVISRWAPTSQTCSECGYRWGKLD